MSNWDVFSKFDFIINQKSPWSLIKDDFSSVPLIAGFAIAAIVCGSIDLKRIKAGLYSRKGKGLDIIFLLVFLLKE